jgi:hypothetical protein
MENKELNEFLNNSELVPMVFLGSKGFILIFGESHRLRDAYSKDHNHFAGIPLVFDKFRYFGFRGIFRIFISKMGRTRQNYLVL